MLKEQGWNAIIKVKHTISDILVDMHWDTAAF